MTVYRNSDQEDKINDAYKKVLEADKEKISEMKDKRDKAFKWTHGINDAYKKILGEQTYICTGADCGHTFHSAWKEKDLKCKKCGSVMKPKGH